MEAATIASAEHNNTILQNSSHELHVMLYSLLINAEYYTLNQPITAITSCWN